MPAQPEKYSKCHWLPLLPPSAWWQRHSGNFPPPRLTIHSILPPYRYRCAFWSPCRLYSGPAWFRSMVFSKCCIVHVRRESQNAQVFYELHPLQPPLALIHSVSRGRGTASGGNAPGGGGHSNIRDVPTTGPPAHWELEISRCLQPRSLLCKPSGFMWQIVPKFYS